jgi:hypothetical protein
MNTFKLYLPLCWLKVNPLDLPKSVNFLKQNFWFYFVVELFIQANMIDPSEAFFEVIVETSLTFGFVGLILFLNKSTHLYWLLFLVYLLLSGLQSAKALSAIIFSGYLRSGILYSLLL